MKFKNFLFTAIFASTLFSCSNDDDNSYQPLGVYDNGAIILNEGGFGNSNASISFVSDDLEAIENNVFSSMNGQDLGDVAQSIGFNGAEAYIVVNNSNKIEVVDRYSFGSITMITNGLAAPRYFAVSDNTGYVTNWGDPTDATDDYVAVINLSDYSVETTIPVSEGPERIAVANGKVFISHLGGYSTNNVISVIEGENVSEITVNDNPDEMFVENGSLYVLSQGITDWSGNGNDTAGAIQKINISTNEVEQTIEFEVSNHPSQMVFENGKIYYSAGGEIFEMDANATTLPTNSILSGYFYGMAAENGLLYVTDAGNFASQGTLKIFDLGTYNEVASFSTGIGPNQIYFN